MTIGIRVGDDVRPALCGAIDAARERIEAEFFHVDDPAVVASLNRAAARGVDVHIVIEGDPHRFRHGTPKEPDERSLRGALSPGIDLIISHAPDPLVHAKAVVIDDAVALIGTANATRSGLDDPGDLLAVDRRSADVAAVREAIDRTADGAPPPRRLRSALDPLLASHHDLRIASEDLSDPRIERALVERARSGRHDRVLVNEHPSKASRKAIRTLEQAGVAVRSIARAHMHGKLIDDGDRIYLGSANLTFNGIDEADEIGIVAPDHAFTGHGAAVRAYFDGLWGAASAVRIAR